MIEAKACSSERGQNLKSHHAHSISCSALLKQSQSCAPYSCLLQIQQFKPNDCSAIDSNSKRSLFASKPYLEVCLQVNSNHPEYNLRFNLKEKSFLGLRPGRASLHFPKAEYGPPFEHRIQSESADTCKERLDAQFEERRSLLVGELRTILMHDRYFSIHELHKEKAPRRSVIEQIPLDQLTSESAEKLGVVLQNIDPQTFLQLCTKEKNVSRALQIYIACAPVEMASRISQIVKINLKVLLKDQFGNYVVQQICKRESGIVPILEELVWKNFPSMVRDEFASRSMQGLAQLSGSFRSKIFVWYKDHLEEIIECVPAIFLLISAFSSAETPSEFKPFTERVNDPMTRKLITNKNFKRILACYLEHCDLSEVEHVSSIFKLRSKIFTLLDDKYGSLLLVAVLQRGQNAILKTYLSLLRNNLQQLFQTKFFKSFFFKLAKPPTPTWISFEMHEALLDMPLELFKKVTAARASRYFYCFLLAVTLQPSAGSLTRLTQFFQGLYDQTKLLTVLSDMIESK